MFLEKQAYYNQRSHIRSTILTKSSSKNYNGRALFRKSSFFIKCLLWWDFQANISLYFSQYLVKKPWLKNVWWHWRNCWKKSFPWGISRSRKYCRKPLLVSSLCQKFLKKSNCRFQVLLCTSLTLFWRKMNCFCNLLQYLSHPWKWYMLTTSRPSATGWIES